MIFDETNFDSGSPKFKFITKVKEEKKMEKNYLILNKNRYLLTQIESNKMLSTIKPRSNSLCKK